MAGTVATTATNRYAVVTGANKGLGFEICRQLASNGIMVILTARDEKRGTEALEKLKGSGLSDLVVFHQLDVANTSSIASLADFVKTHFGRLDILVNNAGISGALVNWDAFKATGAPAAAGSRDQINWNELMTQTYELAKECLETNYYGAKGMIEAFIPLLQLSDSPRIVNVSSGMGKLKVNNAGIMGAMVDWDAIKISLDAGSELKLNEVMTQTYELTKECLETNYYGAKRMIDAFIPLLQLSNSPRIVNISSVRGKLKYIPSEWAKGELNDTEGLTEERIEEVLKVFLKDFKDGSVETKGWPPLWSAYTVSKAALNSYTRILAEKYPTFRINCVCPGSVKTDINSNNGKLGAEEGAASVVTLALVPKDGPSGLFFDQKEVASFVERVFLVAGFS